MPEVRHGNGLSDADRFRRQCSLHVWRSGYGTHNSMPRTSARRSIRLGVRITMTIGIGAALLPTPPTPKAFSKTKSNRRHLTGYGAKLAINSPANRSRNCERLHRPLRVRLICSTQFPLDHRTILRETCNEVAESTITKRAMGGPAASSLAGCRRSPTSR